MPVSQDRRKLLLACAGGSALSGAGCSTAPASPEDAERYIAQRSREWTACFSSGDASVMEQILAIDFVSTGPRGDKSNRAESIAAARKGPDVFASTALAEVTVRLHGTTAIAFGGDVLKLRSGSPAEVRTAWTDTWLLRNGAWQVVASHECVIRPE
jgi:hypothetical protein